MTLLSLEQQDGVTVAVVAGEVDAVNADQLRAGIEQTADRAGAGVVLDLADVVYIDSAGVHALYTVARRLQERGQELVLVVPAGSLVEDTLRYADALDGIGAAPTRAEAVARITSAR